jgi:hypothetical protein
MGRTAGLPSRSRHPLKQIGYPDGVFGMHRFRDDAIEAGWELLGLASSKPVIYCMEVGYIIFS